MERTPGDAPTPGAVAIRELPPRGASDAELAAVQAFRARLRAERWPDDPPLAADSTAQEYRNRPDFAHTALVPAWRDDEVVALAALFWREAEDNRHAAFVSLQVLPEWRRRGLARRLLARVAEAARAAGRTLLIGDTDSGVPAGDALAERLGARPGLRQRIGQLDLDRLDRALLEGWIARARERAADAYELTPVPDPMPEALLGPYLGLEHVMNSAPRDDLEIEDVAWTPAQLRAHEAARRAQGVERLTLAARHRASGALAGYTELFWNPREPHFLSQGNTGVAPEHRGRGLGRWLKAAHLLAVLELHPEARRVRTNNAASNGAMLAINDAMGFRPVKEVTAYQLELAGLERYLRERGLLA